MADLDTKTFDQLVEQQATAVQSEATSLTDFSVGSLPRAFAQAFAAVVMWLQGLILQLLTTTRAATSEDGDLDTWMADFSVTRLAAVAASGPVTFARYTAGAQASVLVGSLVQTADGTQQYQVIADTTQPAYDAASSSYILAIGTTAITATIQALTAGAAGNATAGAINTLGQSISGVDTVVNAAAFDNGKDAEGDIALRSRFTAYIASLSKATKAAIGYAITSLQQGLTYALTEWFDYAGNAKPGYFYVVVDDGSGAPPSALLNSVASAVDDVRAFGVQFNVYGPTTLTANIALSIGIGTGYDAATVRAAVTASISTYISSLGLGESLLWSRLYQVAYDVSEGVTSVSGLLINGSASDLVPTAKQVVVPGTIVVG